MLLQDGPWAAHTYFVNDLVDQTIRCVLLFSSAGCFRRVLDTQVPPLTKVPCAFLPRSMTSLDSSGIEACCTVIVSVTLQRCMPDDDTILGLEVVKEKLVKEESTCRQV